MAKLPQLRRLLQEDFPDQPWIGKLFFPLNLFMNAVFSALNNNLTFDGNFLGMTKTVSIAAVVPPAGTPYVQFPWSYVDKPLALWIGNTVDTSATPATITNAVTCAWSYSSGVISINNITGLNSAKTYSITFVVVGA